MWIFDVFHGCSGTPQPRSPGARSSIMGSDAPRKRACSRRIVAQNHIVTVKLAICYPSAEALLHEHLADGRGRATGANSALG